MINSSSGASDLLPPPHPPRQNRWYIHNASNASLNYGATNVLAIRVDAQTFQEGWFYEGGSTCVGRVEERVARER